MDDAEVMPFQLPSGEVLGAALHGTALPMQLTFGVSAGAGTGAVGGMDAQYRSTGSASNSDSGCGERAASDRGGVTALSTPPPSAPPPPLPLPLPLLRPTSPVTAAQHAGSGVVQTQLDSNKSKVQDSTSLFTLCSPRTFEIRVITHTRVSAGDDVVMQFVVAVHSTVDDQIWQANMTLSKAGFRQVESENIPVWNMGMEFSDHTEKYVITTNQAIIKLMSIIRPADDVNQTNQRLRRKWQAQHMFRVSAQDARVLSTAFPDMAYVKFRAGLVLIEWPTSEEVIGCLTADKQVRPRRIAPTVATKSKGQLATDVKRLERENEQLRAQLSVLQRVVESLTATVRAGQLPPQAPMSLSQPPSQSQSQSQSLLPAHLTVPALQPIPFLPFPSAAGTASTAATPVASAALTDAAVAHSVARRLTAADTTAALALTHMQGAPAVSPATSGRAMGPRMLLPTIAALMEDPSAAVVPGPATAATGGASGSASGGGAASVDSRLLAIDERRARQSPI